MVIAVLMAAGARLGAQAGPALGPSHFTASLGLIASGGYRVGDRTAELRRNSPGTPSPFTLFRADSKLERAAGFEARVSFGLTRQFAVEVGATFAKPQLGVTITQDTEGDPSSLVAEEISQYTLDVGALMHLPWVKLGSRLQPYVIGGGGYLRQLHEDRLLVETGRTVYVGGGIQYWLRRGSATSRAYGVRADTRYVHRTRGIDFEDRSRGYPVASVLGFVGF